MLFCATGGAWIRGDGYEHGHFDGGSLARRFGVLVVAVQYRLGPFGFLAHPAFAAEDAEGAIGRCEKTNALRR